MNSKEFNEELQQYFDNVNQLSLIELLLFTPKLNRFVESEARRLRIQKVVTDICGYDASAREFAHRISYNDFRNRKTIGELSALGMKLFLFYECGVDWGNPDARVKGFAEH